MTNSLLVPDENYNAIPLSILYKKREYTIVFNEDSTKYHGEPKANWSVSLIPCVLLLFSMPIKEKHFVVVKITINPIDSLRCFELIDAQLEQFQVNDIDFSEMSYFQQTPYYYMLRGI